MSELFKQNHWWIPEPDELDDTERANIELEDKSLLELDPDRGWKERV